MVNEPVNGEASSFSPVLVMFLALSVSCAGCGGGNAGGVAQSASVAGTATPTVLSAAQARAEAQANGTGNPTASLDVQGTISGQIQRTVAKGKGPAKDEPAAQARISTDRGGFATRADASGFFTLRLPASSYTLTIHSPGFRTQTLRDVPAIFGFNTDLTSELKSLQPLGASDVDSIDATRPVTKAFVGAGQCRACHTSIFTAYTRTKHFKPIRYVGDPVEAANGFDVVGDFSPSPGSETRDLTFTSALVGGAVQARLKRSANNRYFVTLQNRGSQDSSTFEVHRTHGGTGDWKQRYQTQIGGSFYTLPVQWNEKETDLAKKWVSYNPEHWWDANGNVRSRFVARAGVPVLVKGPEQKQSYERKCFGCHGTLQGVHRVSAIQSQAGEGDEGDYVAEYSSLVISCENCHGPGWPHVETQNVNDIINPSPTARRTNKLAFARAQEVCGQCHVRGVGRFALGSVAGVSETTSDRTLGYPWRTDDKPYKIGDDLVATAYDVSGSSKYWNSGATRNQHPKQHHQQWLDSTVGAHGFQTAQVGCFDCHDAHGFQSENREHLLLARADDNSLCLKCHGKSGTARNRFLLPGETSTDSTVQLVTSHTRHSYDPTGAGGSVSSRCVACHMVKTAKSALPWDIADHTMRVIKPVESLDMFDAGGNASDGLVIPHSCASSTVGCHNSGTSPGGNYLVGVGDLRSDSTARVTLLSAVNAYESKFGTRKSTGSDVAATLGAIEGAVTLGGVPIEGARVSPDRGEDYDVTAADGKFRLLLPGGTYNLRAQHPSFKTTTIQNVSAMAGAVNAGIGLVLQSKGTEAAYVGSQKCKICHDSHYDKWVKTLHNRGLRYVDAGDDRDLNQQIVADFGAEGVGRTISSTVADFAALGSAQIRLLRQNGKYTMTLVNGDGTTFGTFEAVRSYGGGRGDWKQRFLTRLPGGGEGNFILPAQWGEAKKRWKPYHLTDHWFDSTAQKFKSLAKRRSFEYRCIACHSTGLEAEYVAAVDEVRVRFSELNTGCERCHGPGGDHYRTGDKTKILNPSNFLLSQQKNLCSGCHTRGNSVAAPDGNNSSGYPVASRTETSAGSGVFSLKLYSAKDSENNPASTGFLALAPTVWSEDTYKVTSTTADPTFSPVTNLRPVAKGHRQQGIDFSQGLHSAFLTCSTCHDPHGGDNPAQLKKLDGSLIVNGQINEGNLCLQCHGPNGVASRKFTTVDNLKKHFVGGISSHTGQESVFTCTKCHFVATASTFEKWDIKSHGFKAIEPQVSLNMWLSGGDDNSDPTRQGVGTTTSDDIMPNSCNGCHQHNIARDGSLAALKTGVSIYNAWKSGGGGAVQ